MLFSSTVFLFLFLPAVCFVYFLIDKRAKNYVLLAASLFFYAWGEPRYLALMLLLCIVNWLGGIALEKTKRHELRRLLLTAAVLFDLGFLVYFKYMNFILENISYVLERPTAVWNIVMPIGISFYTFQALSYLVDVYRQEVSAQRNFFQIALYISFFPQLIAGPIVKYHDVRSYLQERKIVFPDVVYGVKRFIIGLGKKVLLANTLGETADKIFAPAGGGGIDLPIAWLGAIAYSLQLYFDFSGYSDMAIGLGRIFGFRFLENFNYPYISSSITEFWRRWHISLGTWFREYVYIPLGGNRKGKYRTYGNLALVFFATGIWHGANWTFLIWGVWHGCFILLERFLGWNKENRRCVILRHLYTIFVFVVGWVMFRSDSFHEGVRYIAIMFGFFQPQNVLLNMDYFLNYKTFFVLFVAILASTPLPATYFFGKCFAWKTGGPILENSYLIFILLLSVSYIAASTYNPFIYFRF